MIYLAFGMFQILFLLGTVNFLHNSKSILELVSALLSILSAIVNFLVALEEAFKSGLDSRVFFIFISCIVPHVTASVLELLIDCSCIGKSILFLATF